MRTSLQTGIARVVAVGDALLRFLLDLVPVILRIRTTTVAVADFMGLHAHAPATLRFWLVSNSDRWWARHGWLGNIVRSTGTD